MRASLTAGLEGTFRYRVSESKTVPHIYPEASDLQAMPKVFATGYMVALVKWACVELIKPHLDWPREMTLGTHVDLSHLAPTLPGMTVEVASCLLQVDGRRLVFRISARDDLGLISEGRHERHVIDPARFVGRLRAIEAKLAKLREIA
jgi:fluoroacetyl-CoA thioesterase